MIWHAWRARAAAATPLALHALERVDVGDVEESKTSVSPLFTLAYTSALCSSFLRPQGS